MKSTPLSFVMRMRPTTVSNMLLVDFYRFEQNLIFMCFEFLYSAQM